MVNHLRHIDLAQYPRRVRWFMGVAWAIIVAKCVLVWWAVDHWNMPFHPLWVVGPTIMFALLITVIWATHHEE